MNERAPAVYWMSDKGMVQDPNSLDTPAEPIAHVLGTRAHIISVVVRNPSEDGTGMFPYLLVVEFDV